MSFLTDEQKSLANEISDMLVARNEKVSVAESSTGGLVSAALLWVPGASRYFAGGGVVYTLKSRTALAGANPDDYKEYRGTTPVLLEKLGAAMQGRLESHWTVAESGLAGPPGARVAASGKTSVAIIGPVSKTEILETGSDDREENMSLFTTHALRLFRDALAEAGK